jgi:hypothetical protein
MLMHHMDYIEIIIRQAFWGSILLTAPNVSLDFGRQISGFSGTSCQKTTA